MPRVLHLLDETADWQHRVAITQLAARAATGELEQVFATIGPADSPAHPAGVEITRLAAPLGMAALAAPAVQRVLREARVDLVHAWGPTAAASARAAAAEIPLVVTVFDPGLSPREIGVLRTIARPAGFAVVCAAGRVRQRLVEQGVELEHAVLIRPAVDFAVVNAARQSGLRAELGVPEDALLIVAGDPPRAGDGLFASLWSANMRWYLDERVRIVLPPVTRVTRELKHFSDASATPQVAIFPDARIPFEQLCAVADVLAIGDIGEIPTTAVAWAMASSTTVVAPATYAVSELIAHDVNGLLFKAPADRRRRGAALCSKYERMEAAPRLREAARGQAYEVFSLRRFVQQHRQLYANLLAGRSPADDIHDPASVAV